MKQKINITELKEIEVDKVLISIAVRFEDEDMPYDFPLRQGDTWEATVMIDTGEILNWPKGKKGEFYMKVVDEGTYTLINKEGSIVAKIERNYVPDSLIPGEYGDYVDLKIDENGIITNWPEDPDISEFFQQQED